MDQVLLNALKSKFIVFDGPDGCGKTTQFRKLGVAARAAGLSTCEVREPGGTAISEKIRDLLLDPENNDMAVRAEMLLYMASRAQLVTQRMKPAMERGELVLSDRFISSTLAYQGNAGGMTTSDILSVGKIACGDVWPDLVIIFDVDQQTAARRLNPLLDRMEQKGEAYHQKVREGYLKQAEKDPKGYLVLDARPDADTVHTKMLSALKQRFLQGGGA